MTWNPEGRALQERVEQLLAELPVQVGEKAQRRWAATIVMRFQQAQRSRLQAGELDTAERYLAKLNGQLSKLNDLINTMPAEVRWILDSDLRDLDAGESDDYMPAPIDDDGLEQLTRLLQCVEEISAMEEVTAAWAAEAAASKGKGGNPGAVVQATVADVALLSFERLTGGTVGKNPEGNPIDYDALGLATKLFELFDLKGRPGAPRYHLFCAIDRKKALAA